MPPLAPIYRWTRYLRIFLWIVLAVLFVSYVAVFAYIAVNQDQLTFPAPQTYPHATPASAGMPFEDLRVPVNSTEYLHAWYVPAAQPSPEVILFFHGNGYTIERAIQGELAGLHRTGANVLMVDYRGYGESSPRQTTALAPAKTHAPRCDTSSTSATFPWKT